MCSWRSCLVGAFLVAGLLLPSLRADEASFKDGRRLAGALRLGKTGRLLFSPRKGASVPLADLAEVRLTPTPSPPLRLTGARRVRLTDGQQLTGGFLGLQKKSLVLRTAWADKVSVPRAAVAALTHLPGWLPVFEDDLRAGIGAWKARGAPSTGRDGARLASAGQALDYLLPAPLSAGRIGINFEASEGARGARWLLEATFAARPAPRVVRITVAGPGEHYQVDSAGLAGSAPRVSRSPGPHRLIVTFSPRSLRITSDDEVLWFNLEKGPGGALRRVSLKCVEDGKGGAVNGAVVWAEFAVERAAREWPRPEGDPTQDELWLASGDQLFGKVVRAERKEVALEAHFGTRAFPWTELRGWFPRLAAPRPKAAAGAIVRARLRNGADAFDDVLDGVVTALNDKHLTLRHALLGELRIERRRVVSLRPR
jgi:hypothetical protein